MTKEEIANIELRLSEYVMWCESNRDLCPVKNWVADTINKLIKEIRDHSYLS